MCVVSRKLRGTSSWKVVTFLSAVLLVACAETGSDGNGDAATSPAPLRLPEDEGAHDVPLEWWYYTGHLASDEGRRWGFQVAFFKHRSGADLYLGNFAITDIDEQRFFFTEKAWFDAAAEDGYALDMAGWRVSGTGGRDTLQVAAADHALSLSFSPLKPVVMHGGDGTVGGGQDSTQYYSWTRLEASGTLTSAGEAHAVSGLAWMDHQWFDRDVQLSDLKWDWLSLQLDDSVDLMLAVLRDDDAELVGGTWVDASGEATELGADDFTIEALGEWENAESGNTYPMGWRVQLPARQVELTVAPVLRDQELHGLTHTPIDYWEGAVEVHGTRQGTPVRGQGYVELTGYARP